jgi:peptide/nickel transport system ATP-binding protein
MSNLPPLLDVQDLHIDVQAGGRTKHVVRSASFSVQAGQTVCIVGESGCGKSLTALALLGLLPPAARRRVGSLTFEGADLTSLDAAGLRALRGSRMAMIFQDPMTSLNPVFTIGTQLADVMLRHRRVNRREALERAGYLLRRVGITDPERRLAQYPFELSGGLRQRVMIAMALMCGPKLLIADEPTTALDVTVQAELLELLRSLQAEIGLGMVFISHDLGLVSRVADHVIVMYAGDIVEAGPAREVIDRPQHPYTSMLLGCIPRPGVTVARSVLPSIAGTVPSLDQPIAGCAFQDRCPVAEARCATLQVTAADSRDARHRCLCVKPGAMAKTELAA